MFETTAVDRTQILNEINRSSHGKLAEYQPIIAAACKSDPEFVARLIAFDFTNGQIKDSKLALPIISLAATDFPDELVENSLAHLAMQPPRELHKALQFSLQSGTVARRQRALENMIRRYLRAKEAVPGKWSHLAARHRRPLKALYSLAHAKNVPEWVSAVLFGFVKRNGEKVAINAPAGSIFHDIANLNRMAPDVISATIQKWHLPPLVVSGALYGSKEKQQKSAVVQATVDQMSDTEVVTQAKTIERRGLGHDQALKEKVRGKIAKATKSNKATLKTGVAAEEVEDESLKTMLRELQERQIQAQKDAGRGIEGNWLVIVDKSISQDSAIELGKHIAAAITKFVTGRVWLVFCDTSVSGSEVTGIPLDKIKAGTRFVKADGGTLYGVGLEWAMDNKYDINGIAVVGDGGENRPSFSVVYADYVRKHGDKPPVYFFQTYCEPRYASSSAGDPRNFERSMDAAGYPISKFDLTHGKVDYYSIPNLVQTMNASRFGLIDRVMACPLLTLDQVLPQLAVVGR